MPPRNFQFVLMELSGHLQKIENATSQLRIINNNPQMEREIYCDLCSIWEIVSTVQFYNDLRNYEKHDDTYQLCVATLSRIYTVIDVMYLSHLPQGGTLRDLAERIKNNISHGLRQYVWR